MNAKNKNLDEVAGIFIKEFVGLVKTYHKKVEECNQQIPEWLKENKS